MRAWARPSTRLTAADTVLSAAPFTPSLRSLQLPRRALGRCVQCPPAGIHAARPRPGHRNAAPDRALDRASACRGLHGARPVRQARCFLAQARDHLGQRLPARAGARLRRQGQRLRGDPALGHDRDPGRALYAAGRSARDLGDDRRPAEPGHRGARRRSRRPAGAARHRGRAAGARMFAVPRLSRQSGGQRSGVHRRRLVPHRRPRGAGRRRPCRASPAAPRM